VRLTQVSRGIAVAASHEDLWREVLVTQFDVVGHEGGQKAEVFHLLASLSLLRGSVVYEPQLMSATRVHR